MRASTTWDPIEAVPRERRIEIAEHVARRLIDRGVIAADDVPMILESVEDLAA